MSERRPAYPAHAPDMDEDKDEDDKPLVRPATRKEPAKEKSDLCTDDEDLLPLVPPRLPPEAPVRKKKKKNSTGGFSCYTGTSGTHGTRASEQKIPQFGAQSEALGNIINKLFDERNLRDLHLKYFHMSTAQFKKRTTFQGKI